jgi:hypothetical protein
MPHEARQVPSWLILNVGQNSMISVAILVFAFAILAGATLFEASRGRRVEEVYRGWRVRCETAGRWIYEEKVDGKWVGLSLEVVGDYRESPVVIDIRDASRWAAVPSWARGRRVEIVARIASELRSPRYKLKELSESDLARLNAVPKLVQFRIIDDHPVI